MTLEDSELWEFHPVHWLYHWYIDANLWFIPTPSTDCIIDTSMLIHASFLPRPLTVSLIHQCNSCIIPTPSTDCIIDTSMPIRASFLTRPLAVSLIHQYQFVHHSYSVHSLYHWYISTNSCIIPTPSIHCIIDTSVPIRASFLPRPFTVSLIHQSQFVHQTKKWQTFQSSAQGASTDDSLRFKVSNEFDWGRNWGLNWYSSGRGSYFDRVVGSWTHSSQLVIMDHCSWLVSCFTTEFYRIGIVLSGQL